MREVLADTISILLCYRDRELVLNLCSSVFGMHVVHGNFMLLVISLQNAKPTLGSKPCLVFTGDAFDGDAEYKRLKNCLIGEISTACVFTLTHIDTH